MSEHIDALILIGYGDSIIADVPNYAHDDNEQGLSYIYEGKKQWYNGEPITESDKLNLYASEVFLKLGRLTAGIYLNEPISFIKNANTSKFLAIDAIRSFSPLAEGEVLDLPFESGHLSSRLAENGLPRTFKAALARQPSILSELTSKWTIAQEIYAKRGEVTLPGYNLDELLEGIKGLNMEEIAPTDITGTSYSVKDLLNHAKVEPHIAAFPYYATFDERTNATQILDSALDDLKLLSEAIK